MTQEWKENLVKTYDRYAAERDQGQVDSWKVAVREQFLQRVRQMRKSTLLEIGAGTGRDGKFFHDQGLKVVCIDISPEMVRLCKEKGLSAYVMDLCKMEFLESSFDAIWALNCLLHVPKGEFLQVLRKIESVLKPGGLFYLGMYGGYDSEGVWEKDYYQPRRFFSFYNDEQIQKTVSEVFDLLDFGTVPIRDELHFQSMILRKREQNA